MLRSSTIQLLRFHFSFFLMPVYWFALSQLGKIQLDRTILVFIILHLLLYPSSNGYNSYMDKDTASIGGIKNPRQPTRELFYTSILLDIAALICSSYLGKWFFAGVLAFIAASRAYSYRGIRLKKYPVWGYLTVILFQGGLVFFLVMTGCGDLQPIDVPITGMITASLLIGGFYPLTQIYQHEEDKKDAVNTLSYLLGYRGTFIFTTVIYCLAMASLALLMASNHSLNHFFLILAFFIPVLIYFGIWFHKVYHDVREANYKNSMRMNLVASFFTNAAFIFLVIIEHT